VPAPETAFIVGNRRSAGIRRNVMTLSFARFPALSAFVFLSSLVSLSPVHALTYLVGAGAVPSVCDFNSLQSAINAAAASPGEDFIRVASDQSYSALALTIGQQDLTLTGGYANCSAALPPDALPSGSTILNGAGGAAAPVVSISGSGVRVLGNFQIRNGDNVQGNGLGCGGGIHFNGRGELRIQNVGISQNNANSGGGICFVGTAVPTALSIESDVSINNNNATTGNGGGIAIAGTARMFALRDRTLIAFNGAANGNGGGLYLQPPAAVDIGSPGFNGTGVIFGNTARRGGGVAGNGLDGSTEDACVRFFTTDASRPVRIQNNRASEFGGALFLQSHLAMEEHSSVYSRLYDFVVDGNTAPNGPAIFLQGDSSAFITGDNGPRVGLNDFSASCNEPVDALGAVRCTQSAQCNRIDGNRAEDINGQPANGNIIEMRLYAAIAGQTVTMKGNTGTRLISWSDGNETDFTVSLFRSALIDNTLTQELFRGFSDGEFRLVDSTVAGNSIGAAHVFRHDADNNNQITNAVIDQPGKLTLSHPNVGSLDVVNTWVIATDTSSLRPDPTALPARGRFTDPERGDYRLRIGSQALDYAPGTTPTPASDVDLDGRLRNFDQGDISANTRARDVGAFERQNGDRWLPNGDFVGDLRLWFNPEPSYSTWDAAFNAPVSSGGSLSFLVPADQTTPTDRRTALTHCFNVPWSGDYQISGFALVAASQNNRDYPVLNWRLRYDSEDCSGPENVSGDAFFGRSGSAWQPLFAPLTVSVDPAQWSWNTTIEIRLEVAQNITSPTATSLFARFDEIEIRKASDALFADGFESAL
jgi:hypothetical protein